MGWEDFLEQSREFMRLIFVLLNLLSFCVFYCLGRVRRWRLKRIKEGVTPNAEKRWPMRLVLIWAIYRVFNYVFLISLIGTYTDDFVVLGLTFLIDYHFLYLRYEGPYTERFKLIRGAYTAFNVLRITVFLSGFFFMGGSWIFAFPYSNLKKESDFKMLDSYWMNKSNSNNVITHKGSNITIIRVLKHTLFTKRVVFSRTYYFFSSYYSAFPHDDTVHYGKDSVSDTYSGTYIYKKHNNYYITYPGDGHLRYNMYPRDSLVMKHGYKVGVYDLKLN